MENTYSELTKEQLLLHLMDCIYHLYTPSPSGTEKDFNQGKEKYLLLKEAWININEIKGKELFSPFQLREADFEKLKSLHQLNGELMRSNETGKPNYNMLSANPSYNLPQRQRKQKIINLALSSCGIQPEKLFSSPLRRLKKFLNRI